MELSCRRELNFQYFQIRMKYRKHAGSRLPFFQDAWGENTGFDVKCLSVYPPLEDSKISIFEGCPMRNQRKSMIRRCRFWVENGGLPILETPRSRPREGVGEGINPYPSEEGIRNWLIWLNLVNWILGKGINGVG